jgi:hypothetical protein
MQGEGEESRGEDEERRGKRKGRKNSGWEELTKKKRELKRGKCRKLRIGKRGEVGVEEKQGGEGEAETGKEREREKRRKE